MSGQSPFFTADRSIAASEIASIAGIAFRSKDFSISAGAALETASTEDLSYMDNHKYLDALKATNAGACLVSPRFSAFVPENTFSFVTREPYLIYSKVLALLYPGAASPRSVFETAGISPKATVHGSAVIGSGVTIDPGAVVGPRSNIGDYTCIGSNVVIGPDVTIGRNCSIGAGAILAHATIGDNVIIHPGVSIGQDGFGFVPGSRGHIKIPQVGGVIIQDNIEIGANTTIDRGSTRNTFIGEGTKIDNLVQIAHNVVVGRHCLIAAQVGIAGSATLGDFVAIGGQTGIAPHLTIGDSARIAGASGVTRDIPRGERWAGFPARPSRKFFRQYKILEMLAVRKPRED
ncbi:MAG: UDP-3-O-[3-hydroxymyristoyl] glucosamine N-acyltransferase [Tardiphaga sp.]|jgi:UDP-3-O-[3-hydroxymyristoyl] glucosamine N-acyltransferase|nr:UDP-3-O-[3-hydroxymyristoyl] glucosamine N-acyltransferase [Tardiphaga sp.]